MEYYCHFSLGCLDNFFHTLNYIQSCFVTKQNLICGKKVYITTFITPRTFCLHGNFGLQWSDALALGSIGLKEHTQVTTNERRKTDYKSCYLAFRLVQYR